MQEINKSIAEIEKEIGYKIMFGALGGSFSFGLQNGSSDIDCYLVIDNEKLLNVIHQKINIVIQGKPTIVDFMCIGYQEMLREIERYENTKKKYPTVLYRTEDEKRNNVGKRDTERLDFKRSVLFRILLSDKVINRECVQSKYRELIDGMKIVDLIDYHYTRIYGNYNEKIANKNFIPIRKYLYTIHEICTCKNLMKSTQKPPMDITQLINATISDVRLKEKINFLYEKNKYAEKDKEAELIYKDKEINKYIVESMNCICDYLKGYEHTEDYLCIY